MFFWRVVPDIAVEGSFVAVVFFVFFFDDLQLCNSDFNLIPLLLLVHSLCVFGADLSSRCTLILLLSVKQETSVYLPAEKFGLLERAGNHDDD